MKKANTLKAIVALCLTFAVLFGCIISVSAQVPVGLADSRAKEVKDAFSYNMANIALAHRRSLLYPRISVRGWVLTSFQ